MKQVSKIVTQVESLAEPLCAAHGVELVEVRHLQERGGAVLRITIDRDGPAPEAPAGQPVAYRSGITLEDCTRISRDLSEALDMHEESLPGKYRLEVSSPGLERPLAKAHDFERFAGREVRLNTLAPIDGRRKFQGELLGLEDGVVVLRIEAETYRVPYEAVHRAQLVHHF